MAKLPAGAQALLLSVALSVTSTALTVTLALDLRGGGDTTAFALLLAAAVLPGAVQLATLRATDACSAPRGLSRS